MSVKQQRKKHCVNATVNYSYSAFHRSITLHLAFELRWTFGVKQRTVSWEPP